MFEREYIVKIKDDKAYAQTHLTRCKDCKKRHDSMLCPIAFISSILKNTKVFEYKVSDNWYCADGEHK